MIVHYCRVFVDRGPSCNLGTSTYASTAHDFTSGYLVNVGDETTFYITAVSRVTGVTRFQA